MATPATKIHLRLPNRFAEKRFGWRRKIQEFLGLRKKSQRFWVLEGPPLPDGKHQYVKLRNLVNFNSGLPWMAEMTTDISEAARFNKRNADRWNSYSDPAAAAKANEEALVAYQLTKMPPLRPTEHIFYEAE